MGGTQLKMLKLLLLLTFTEVRGDHLLNAHVDISAKKTHDTLHFSAVGVLSSYL